MPSEDGTEHSLNPLKPSDYNRDWYPKLPQDEKSLSNYLTDEVHRLDNLGWENVDQLTKKYYKPYGREKNSPLPPLQEGFVRLFRGEDNREDFAKSHIIPPGAGRWWSCFLFDASLYTEEGEGNIYYIDVPESVAQQSSVIKLGPEKLDRVSTHPEEFYLPPEYATEVFAESHLLNWNTIHQLLKEGEYTKQGIDIMREDLSEDKNIKAQIKEKLTHLVFSSLSGFWMDQRKPNSDEHESIESARTTEQKPGIVKDVNTAEYLLAKICGWR